MVCLRSDIGVARGFDTSGASRRRRYKYCGDVWLCVREWTIPDHRRTGKPLSMIREELIHKEVRESIAAKKNGDPPPPTVFGTEREAEALSPVINDKRETFGAGPSIFIQTTSTRL